MINRQFINIVFLIGLHSLQVYPFSMPKLTHNRVHPSSSTCLQAEETKDTLNDEEGNRDANVDAKSDTTDILNSPAFLKRKLEVLNKDIAKAEGDLEEATKALEEGKAEWGPDLEKIAKEVRSMRKLSSLSPKCSN